MINRDLIKKYENLYSEILSTITDLHNIEKKSFVSNLPPLEESLLDLSAEAAIRNHNSVSNFYGEKRDMRKKEEIRISIAMQCIFALQRLKEEKSPTQDFFINGGLYRLQNFERTEIGTD